MSIFLVCRIFFAFLMYRSQFSHVPFGVFLFIFLFKTNCILVFVLFPKKKGAVQQ